MEKKCEKSGTCILSIRVRMPIFGHLILRSCGSGFHSLQVSNLPFDELDDDESKETQGYLKRQLNWVQSYFNLSINKHSESDDEDINFSQFCFDDRVTDFELSVWKTLFETVKMGQTITYANLASSINNPKAARAVGSALKKNPVLLMIPCHRVIRNNGTLGRYCGGQLDNCKAHLLQYEQGALVSE